MHRAAGRRRHRPRQPRGAPARWARLARRHREARLGRRVPCVISDHPHDLPLCTDARPAASVGPASRARPAPCGPRVVCASLRRRACRRRLRASRAAQRAPRPRIDGRARRPATRSDDFSKSSDPEADRTTSPPPSRTNWTRLVPPSVLNGHVSKEGRGPQTPETGRASPTTLSGDPRPYTMPTDDLRRNMMRNGSGRLGLSGSRRSLGSLHMIRIWISEVLS